jgi:hypothetical protein
MQLCRAGDGYNPQFLSQQPRQRDLGRSRMLPFGDPVEQINQGLVGLKRFRREARERAGKSELSKVAFWSIFPVKKPLPRGL